MAYRVSLQSAGGELDCRTVATEAEIADAVKDIALNCTFAHGDSITVIDTEFEE